MNSCEEKSVPFCWFMSYVNLHIHIKITVIIYIIYINLYSFYLLVFTKEFHNMIWHPLIFVSHSISAQWTRSWCVWFGCIIWLRMHIYSPFSHTLSTAEVLFQFALAYDFHPTGAVSELWGRRSVIMPLMPNKTLLQN